MPHTSIHHHTTICPSIPPYICMFPLYCMFLICHGDSGASVHPMYQYICQAFLCLSVHPFASQFISHTSCSPSLWAASLLDWMSMDVCYASCCCSFLCSIFIISHISTTMAMTTPLVTVVCSGTSSLSMVTIAPSLMGFH